MKSGSKATSANKFTLKPKFSQEEGTMSHIQVALFDKSPIIKKMLSHCLHYFATDIQSFSNLQEFLIESQKKETQTKNISAIFVDWEMQQEDQPIFYQLQKQFKDIPLVLLYRSNFLPKVNELSKEDFPYRIPKPINPKEVRELFMQLIPRAKKSPIHAFLQFPKTEIDKQPIQKTKDFLPGSAQTSPVETKTGAIQSGETALPKKSLGGDIIEKTLTGIKKLMQKPAEETKSVLDTLSKQSQTITSKSKSPRDTLSKQTKTMTSKPTPEEIKTLSQKTAILPQKSHPNYTAIKPLGAQNLADPASKELMSPDPKKSSQPQSQQDSPNPSLQNSPSQPSASPSLASQKSPTQAPLAQQNSDQKEQESQKPLDKALPASDPSHLAKASPAKENLEGQNLSANTATSKVASEKEQIGTEQTGTKKMKGPAIDKDNLGLNEDTKNDLAPMAIKSSFDTKSQKGGFQSEEQILAFFEKYKDSLQFQKILEKVLKAEIKDIIQNLLEGAEVKALLQEPLEAFKASQQFKQRVEKEISAYVQKELPLIIKSCVQEEIKKIIN